MVALRDSAKSVKSSQGVVKEVSGAVQRIFVASQVDVFRLPCHYRLTISTRHDAGLRGKLMQKFNDVWP